MYKFYKDNSFDFSLVKELPLIFVSDIDETYLKTNFSSIGGLIKTGLQLGIDKIEYPDMPLFYRTIRKIENSALFFISASPKQLLKPLINKFLIDSVPYDGIVLRDTLNLFLSGHIKEIFKPFGYKIFVLLNLFKEFPKKSKIFLIGDNTEDDPDIYFTLFLVNKGILNKDLFEKILKEKQIFKSNVRSIVENIDFIKRVNIQLIFIRRVKYPDYTFKSNILAEFEGTPYVKNVLHHFSHPKDMVKTLYNKGILKKELFEKFFKQVEYF